MGGFDAATGGGVYNNSGRLTLTGSTVSGNTVFFFGGGIYNNSGTVALTNDTFEGNTSTHAAGGAIYNNAGSLALAGDVLTGNSAGTDGGAIYANGGTAKITGSSLTHNTASNGGAISNSGSLTLEDSTVAHNSAGSGGGGLYLNGTVTLTNDTVADNSASSSGGGIYLFGAGLTLDNDTVAGNTASSSGGVYLSQFATLTPYDSIVDGNTAPLGADVFNSGGTFTSQGHNLYGSSSGVTWTGSDIPNANPLLGGLQNNGGSTQTIALLPGSPALGAGGTSGVTVATDQRGFARTVNGAIDVGAFENQGQLFTLAPPAANPTPDAGSVASFNLGSFTDAAATGNLWVVDVSWGDGSADTVFSTTRQGGLATQAHTYTAAGNYTVTVAVTNADNNFGTMTFAVTVNQAVTVSPGSVPVGTVGGNYGGVTFSAGGGSGSYTFSAGGSLDGLTLSPAGALGGIPLAAGTFLFSVTAADDNGGSGSRDFVLVVNLIGTSLTISAPAITYGANGLVTVTVSSAGGTPGGSVALSVDGGPAQVQALAGGATTFTLAGPGAGPHSLSATYAAKGNYAAGGNVANLVVNRAGTTTTLLPPTGTPAPGQTLTLTATVTSAAGVPTGGVTFLDGATPLGPGTLSGGTASLLIPVTAGPHSFTAAYAGDANFLGGSSPPRVVVALTPNQAFVNQAYEDLLHRPADPAGLASWGGALDQGTLTRTLVALGIVSSLEYRADEVQALYQQYLHRAADSAGLLGFTTFLMHGGMVEQAAAMLMGSPEFFQTQAGGSNITLVQMMFQDALHRPANLGEQQIYLAALAVLSRQQVAALLLGTPEYETGLVDGYYATFLRRPASPAEAAEWAAGLHNGLTDEQIIASIVGSDEYFHFV